MPNEQRPLKVFLCHAHSDKDAVKDLYIRLKREGVDVWLDKEKLLPGADWEYEIHKAVHEADVVVVCLTRKFNQAGFRQKEVRLALATANEKPEGDIFIIPARLEECETLNSLKQWHWVDLFDENGYEKLMHSLRARAKEIGADVVTQEGIGSPLVERGPATTETLSTRGIGVRPGIGRAALVFLAAASILTILFSIWKPQILALSPKTGAQLTPLPAEITDAQGVPMVLVPGGKFTMGSNGDIAVAECKKSRSDCSKDLFRNEVPAHEADLSAFYIDKYEVTNSSYKACDDEDVCDPPIQTDFRTDDHYYVASLYADHPVIFVTWEMAKIYCEWRGARLPTEAEWEKAARGTDGRTFPWGEEVDCYRANIYACADQPVSVDGYDNGASPYSAHNMAGNVWEWVQDWYSEDYYSTTQATIRNPQGPSNGQFRVVRGGGWDSVSYYARSTERTWNNPTNAGNSIGFRCAKDAKP